MSMSARTLPLDTHVPREEMDAHVRRGARFLINPLCISAAVDAMWNSCACTFTLLTALS